MDFLLYIFLFLVIFAALSIILPLFWGGVWFPTPHKDIENLLAASELKEGETLMDLGCGDGRVLITAVEKFGAKGIGVEIDPFKVLIARMRIWRAGLSDRIIIIWSSVAKADLSQADVLFIYLSHQAIDRLKKRFKTELKTTARIVTFGFLISGFPIYKAYRNKKGFVYKIGLGKNLDELL